MQKHTEKIPKQIVMFSKTPWIIKYAWENS